jgi:hypothetical protein
MIHLMATEEPCDGCGEEGGVLLLEATGGTPYVGSVALCAGCRIRAEAMLRGSRKSGPRVGNW